MARRIQVFDTTLRDGEQTPGASLTVDEKVQVARQLARLRVDVIEAGFPAASPGEALAVRRIATEVGSAKGAPAIAALARCVPEDVTAAAEALVPARRQQLHVFIATSDIHLTHKLRATRAEVLERITACATQARDLVGPGQQVEFSAEDASRTETPFLLEAYEAALAAGATIINVPDTVGYAEPGEFASLVRQVVRMVGRRGMVSVHCHNDLGLATANTLAAIRAGARQVEVTVNGLGERAGNASLEEVVMTLRTRPTRFRGATTQVAPDQLTATSRLVSFLTGISVQPNKSVVGANAFAHESGIHQDGFLKNALTYEIMTPESVGLTGSTLTLGKLSGRRGFNERLRRLGNRARAHGSGRPVRRGDRPRRPQETGDRCGPDRVGRPASRSGPRPDSPGALGGRQSPGGVEQRQRQPLLRRAHVPRVRGRERAGRRAAQGGRQRAGADHR